MTDGQRFIMLQQMVLLFELFLYILGKGSEIYRKTNSMRNVLHLPSVNGHFDICEFILEHFSKDYEDNNIRNQYIY